VFAFKLAGAVSRPSGLQFVKLLNNYHAACDGASLQELTLSNDNDDKFEYRLLEEYQRMVVNMYVSE